MASIVVRRPVKIPMAAAALFLAAVPVVGEAPAGEPVWIPGTRVALPMPEGFALAERFPGLAREAASASVMVNELPGPYAEIVAGLTDPALAGRGMKVRRREAVEIDGRAATLIHVEQVAAGTAFRKWMGVFGDEEGTVLITATVPASGAGALADALEGVVLGARWDRGHEADPYAALGYRFDDTAGLEFAHETPIGLVLLPPGVEIGVPGEHTMLVVGRTFREVEIGDVAGFARRRLERVEQLSDLAGLEGRAVTYGGLPGWELVGSGRDDDREVAVYQALLLDDKDYLLLVGTAPPADREAAFATFRAVAASLRRNAPEYTLALGCDRDRLLLGSAVGCALRIEGYAPSGLPGVVESANRAFVPGARFEKGGAGFVHSFSIAPEALGEHTLGPLTLDFEGQTLTSNRIALRVLEPPPGDAPVAIAATPARVAVGQPFDVVVVERGVVLGGLGTASSVRIGGKPVVTHKKPGPVAVLVGNDVLEIERGPSVTTQASGADNERVTFYRAVARRPGRVRIDCRFIQGLKGEVEIWAATVEVAAGSQ